MADNPTRANYPAQNAGRPSPNRTRGFWRNSCLAGPQMAGIPTAFNEDELSSDDLTAGSDRHMEVPGGGHDDTGGAIDYFNSQRRK